MRMLFYSDLFRESIWNIYTGCSKLNNELVNLLFNQISSFN